MTFDTYLTTVRDWTNTIKQKYEKQIKIDIIENSDILFRLDFETEYSIAELIVDNPYFAPYRYVSFLVYNVNQSSKAEPIFAYYDNEASTIKEVVTKLDDGIKALINY